MTREQAKQIHEAARALVRHVDAGDLHPADLQRFKQAMWGDPLRCVDTASLIRMARVSIGEIHA